MNNYYVVKPRDTLSKIAASYGVSPRALAEANGIRNMNVIRVNQKLRIPGNKNATTPRPDAVEPVKTEPTWAMALAVQFVDVLNNPIEALKVALDIDGEMIEQQTDSAGRVPHTTVQKRNTPVKVHVEKVTGEWKTVCDFTVSAQSTYLRLCSPKVMLPSEMRPHEGPIQTRKTDTPAPQAPGTATFTRSTNGHPVQTMALECPNQDNLKLGSNSKYRHIVLDAAKRSGISPQAIAAIMNAEAATITHRYELPVIDPKTGKQRTDANGKLLTRKVTENNGEWDTRSASPLSSARGMTQFLDASWIDQAVSDGTYLCAYLKKQGWITTANIHSHQNGQMVEKTVKAFKLADGTLVTKKPLARTLCRSFITGRATCSDANLQNVLDLRFQAEYAIHTAVDYGLQNLKGLEAAGFKVSMLNNGEKAKIIYLCHHLGLADAKAFINNTMTEKRAKYLFEQQVGPSRAAAAAMAERTALGSYLTAHREWLQRYVDDKLNLSKNMCNPSLIEPAKKLQELTNSIKESREIS